MEKLKYEFRKNGRVFKMYDFSLPKMIQGGKLVYTCVKVYTLKNREGKLLNDAKLVYDHQKKECLLYDDKKVKVPIEKSVIEEVDKFHKELLELNEKVKKKIKANEERFFIYEYEVDDKKAKEYHLEIKSAAERNELHYFSVELLKNMLINKKKLDPKEFTFVKCLDILTNRINEIGLNKIKKGVDEEYGCPYTDYLTLKKVI